MAGNKAVRIGLLVGLVVVIILSTAVGLRRFEVEQANRTVELVADYALVAGHPEQFPRLRAAGATGIVVPVFGTGEEEKSRLTERAAAAGLRVSLYLSRDVLNDPVGFARTLRDLQAGEFGTVLFAPEKIPGYPDRIDKLAQFLKDSGLTAGLTEFAEQRGKAALTRQLDYQVVRAHRIKDKELPLVDEETAIARFLRAVRERNIRVLLLPPLPGYSVEQNLAYIQKLATRLRAAGYRLGKAEPLSSVGVWRGQAVALRQALALLAGVLFPVAGVLRALSRLQTAPGGDRRQEFGALISAFGQCVFISLLGALIITGLLSERLFMIKVAQFRGVKLMHLAPLVLLAGCYGWLYRGVQWHLLPFAVKLSPRQRRIVIWLGAVFLALGVAFMIARTGNHLLPIPGWELAFRQWLEDVLWVRPRMKEFLFGHPLLLVGLYIFRTRGPRNALAFGFITLGVVGQASLINTFTHIHTPLLVSAVRTVYGLIFGFFLGMIAVLFLKWLQRLWLRPGVKGVAECRS